MEGLSGLLARLGSLGFAQDGFVAGEVLGFAVFDGIVDDGAYVVVEELARFVVLAALIPPVERAQAEFLRDDAEGVVESPGELLAVGSGVGAERVDGFSKEELGRCIKSLLDERSMMPSQNEESGIDLPYERRKIGYRLGSHRREDSLSCASHDAPSISNPRPVSSRNLVGSKPWSAPSMGHPR